MNKRYQVFISSTYADLKEERSKVIQTIMELDCIPAGMEIFPAIDQEQFEFIKKIIDDCDYYILIIGGRYGSLSDEGISYTEMEYDYATEKNIKVIAFIHENPEEITLAKSEKDDKLRIKLQEFRDKVKTNRLIKFWNRAEDLPGLVALSLSKTIKTYPAIGWIRANSATNIELYQEINEVRKENLQLRAKETNQWSVNDSENLADLTDTIELNGTHQFYNRAYGGTATSKWKTVITWEETFGLISPFLLKNLSDLSVRSMIATEIYNTIPNHIDAGTASIDNQNYQTIKIQFRALGLVNVEQRERAGKTELYWELTKKGESLLMKIRSVKK